MKRPCELNAADQAEFKALLIVESRLAKQCNDLTAADRDCPRCDCQQLAKTRARMFQLLEQE